MRLPSISDFAWPNVEPQPLLRYSPVPEELMRQAAVYVDRVLRVGANPGELPIQRPARFEFEINMRTAKALGLEVPPSLVLRADKIVE
jgi:putative ABC transport system substrate-binding protein